MHPRNYCKTICSEEKSANNFASPQRRKPTAYSCALSAARLSLYSGALLQRGHLASWAACRCRAWTARRQRNIGAGASLSVTGWRRVGIALAALKYCGWNESGISKKMASGKYHEESNRGEYRLWKPITLCQEKLSLSRRNSKKEERKDCEEKRRAFTILSTMAQREKKKPALEET